MMKFSKRVAASIFVLALSLPQLVSAQTPPDVMKAYKSYNAAMQSQDYPSAIKHAKKAWEKAESQMGDHALTGDLAFNYAYIEKNRGDKTKAVKAFERSVDLAALKPENAAALRLEREVELVSSLDGKSSNTKVEKRIDKAMRFAKDNGLNQSVYVGELYVHKTNVCTRRLQDRMTAGQLQIGTKINRASTTEGIQKGNKKCADIAKKAVSIFEASPADTRPLYIALANNYVGYGFESNSNWFAAAMSYQTARDAVEDVYGRDNPIVAETIGRWMNARNYLKRADQLEFAESKGFCSRCWPFKQDRPTVSYKEWVSADFPAVALQRSSGYAIVQLDVSDAGVPENVRILSSFPGTVYDKSSLEAATQLEFPPKTEGEPADYRKDVTIPYSYFLSQGLRAK